MLPEKAFQPRNGRYGMTLEGGGGGGGPTQSTVTQTNVPEWLRPQTEALIGAATQEYFTTTPVTTTDPNTGETKTSYNITGVRPYTPYSVRPQDYFAPFSPLQQQVQYETAGMRRPGAFGTGTQLAGAAGMGGLDIAQQAAQYGQAGFGAGRLGQQLGIEGGGYYGGAAAGMAPEAQQYGLLGARYGAGAAGLTPQAQRYGARAADIGTMGLRAEALGRDVGAEARGFARQAAGMGGLYERMATTPGAVQAYMSPYMQNVVDRQKEAAILDAQRGQLAANMAMARSGTLGGSRQALATAERERALQTQLQNIQAQGLQNAFQQAQAAQQFGVTTGLQGLQGAQAGLGTALQGGQLGLSGIGQAIAGQQAGLQGLGQAGQLYGLGMQGAQAGLQGLGQAGQLYGLGLQGVQQQLAGTAQGMQGAGVGIQGLAGAQAGLGLGLQAGRGLADIANMQQAADISRMQYQAQVGAAQQAQEQALINQAIQNYAMAQQYPYQQLAGYNALLRGYATPTTTVSQYQAAPSAVSQLAGLGTAGIGLAGMANMAGLTGGKKEGGKIEEDGDGIDDLIIEKTMKKVAA